MENDVADLAGVEIEAAVEFAVDDDPAADAGADEDAEDMPGALRGPVREFAVSAHPHVVLEMRLPGPAGRQNLRDLDVVPLEIRRIADLADPRIDLARDANAHPANAAAIDVRLREQILNGGFNLPEDTFRARTYFNV